MFMYALREAPTPCMVCRAFPEPVIGKYCLLQQQELATRAKWAGRFPALSEPAREQLPHA